MSSWKREIPKFSRSVVDASGFLLFGKEKDLNLIQHSAGRIDQAYDVVSNWRSAHNYPLNILQNYLRKRSRTLESNSIIAQRIKRISSIETKISRFPTMRLSMMQDIGGCRAVMGDVRLVMDLVKIYEQSGIKHKLLRKDDYIKNPRASGYRGIHLIYEYQNDGVRFYNGLKIEIQIRTTLQHAWATAVETVGTFTQQALKSSQGNIEWLRFFTLASSALAWSEGTNPVPGTPGERSEMKEELQKYTESLDVKRLLQTYGTAVRELTTADSTAEYYLLELDPSIKEIKIKGYRKRDLKKANADYLAAERNIKAGNNAVLVSSDSVDALRRAYPNYFLDTHVFISALTTVTS